MTDAEKIALVKGLSDWFYENTNSFEGEIGMQLAYLWPAILKDTTIEARESSELIQCARGQWDNETLPPDHAFWKFITLTSELEDPE